METLGLMDRSLYDIGANDLLDVWDTDFPTSPISGDPMVHTTSTGTAATMAATSTTSSSSSSPHSSSAFASPTSPPMLDPILGSAAAGSAVWPSSVINDKLLTDDDGGVGGTAAAAELAEAVSAAAGAAAETAVATSASSSSSSSSVSSGSMRPSDMQSFARGAAAGVGSDGDSLPDSPMSLNDDMETECYPCIPMNNLSPMCVGGDGGMGGGDDVDGETGGGNVKQEPASPNGGREEEEQATPLHPIVVNSGAVRRMDNEGSVSNVGRGFSSSNVAPKFPASINLGSLLPSAPVAAAGTSPNLGYIIKQEPGTPASAAVSSAAAAHAQLKSLKPLSALQICHALKSAGATPIVAPTAVSVAAGAGGVGGATAIVLTTTKPAGSGGGVALASSSAAASSGAAVTTASKLVIPRVNIKLDSNGLVSPALSSSSSDSDTPPRLVSAGHGPSATPLPVPPPLVKKPASSSSSQSGPTKRNSYSQGSGRQPITTPLISSQPKGSTGPLSLTEEEKRTLMSEGYPVPQRMPLSKQEEKSLKKIRRKIKNKISAQESRRKKKEYMDCLERKMDSLHAELSHYKTRCGALEAQNAGLLQQLRKLQAKAGSAAAGGSGKEQQQETPAKLVAIVAKSTRSHSK